MRSQCFSQFQLSFPNESRWVPAPTVSDRAEPWHTGDQEKGVWPPDLATSGPLDLPDSVGGGVMLVPLEAALERNCAVQAKPAVHTKCGMDLCRVTIPTILNDKAREARGLMIQPTRFTEFNIVAVSGGQLHRIAKVMFQNRDGSILPMFPSFAHNEGLVGELSMKAGARAASYGLANHGKVTGHLVKYSHHPDGRAHFSQDGRVRTEIKRQSVPLDRQHSHMFTIQVEGLKSFAPPRVNDKTPALILRFFSSPSG
jgi:hypothetical protein